MLSVQKSLTRVALGCLLALASIASLASGQDLSTDSIPEITQDQIEASIKKITYKTAGNVELQLHIFYPPNHQVSDNRPAIVFFFGGGWVGGSPSQFYKQAWYLSQRGMVAACAEYRIKSKHQTTPKECVMDGKSAIRYVRQNASKMGIDPGKIVAAGGSAGGHVAAATATVTQFNESTDDTSISSIPCALVLFNPVLDNGPDGWGHAKVKDYWQDISPMHNVRSPATLSLFMLGDQDKLIPVETAKKYQEVVKKNDGRCEVVIAKGQGHGYFNRGESFLVTLEATDKFLTSLGLIEGQPTVRKLLTPLVNKELERGKKNQSKKKSKKDSNKKGGSGKKG